MPAVLMFTVFLGRKGEGGLLKISTSRHGLITEGGLLEYLWYTVHLCVHNTFFEFKILFCQMVKTISPLLHVAQFVFH